jgi:hypothetical protein
LLAKTRRFKSLVTPAAPSTMANNREPVFGVPRE